MPPFVTQLVRFRVRNYRCFQSLTFDLRVRHDYDWAKDCLTEEGDLIKMPLVMGPISGGKTSLINTMSDVLLYSMPEPLRSENLCRFFTESSPRKPLKKDEASSVWAGRFNARMASLLDTVVTRPDSVFRITHESNRPLPSLTLRQLRRRNNIPKPWRAGEFSDQ